MRLEINRDQSPLGIALPSSMTTRYLLIKISLQRGSICVLTERLRPRTRKSCPLITKLAPPPSASRGCFC